MMWPQPVNVRMNAFRAGMLLDALRECTSDQSEIFDFPEYGHELDASQKTRLRALAHEIIRSHASQSPIAGIAVVGHADQAMRLSGAAKKAKEMKVSEQRARTAQEELIKMLRSLPGGDSAAAMVSSRPYGVGASDPIFVFPLNDEQRKRNRRVVFKWSRCRSQPIIHPPLPIPNNVPNDDDNPNVVFAGNRFRMIILDGESVGTIMGIFSYHILLWDIDNKRAAQYLYTGLNKSVGAPPFSECEVSDWSSVFTTQTPCAVDRFGGTARHGSVAAVLMSGMQFSFGTSLQQDLRISPTENLINIFMGPAKAFSAETGGGSFTYVEGSIQVLKDGNSIAALPK